MPTSNPNSLVAIEEHFRELLHNLSVFQSNRFKVTLLTDFFDQLNQKENPVLYQSYYQELLPYLLEQLTEEALLYRPIDQLLKLNKVLLSSRELCPEESGSVEFVRTLQIVKQAMAKTYFYLGEWNEGLSVIWQEFDHEKYENYRIDIDDGNDGSNLEKFDRLVSAMIKKDGIPSEVGAELQEIIHNWKQTVGNAREDCIYTLLTEQQPDSGIFHDEISLGTIKSLCLKLTVRPRDADEDHLLFNNRVMSYNDLIHQQSQDALTTGKKIFFHDAGKSIPFYKMLFSFPDKASFYTGDSLGVAMGLLSLASMSFLHTKKFRYKLMQEVVVTGPLDMLGNVRPISDKALKTKLQTVFFSPFKSVVLPAKNRDKAETILKELNKNYGNRNLNIIYADKLSDCLNEPAVVHKERISLGERITKKTQRKGVLGIAVFVFLILMGMNFLSNRDNNPSRLEVMDKTMTVYNSSNRKLWQYEFKTEFVRPEQYKATHVSQPLYIIDDLDGDGKNEVVIGFGNSTKKEIDGSILYFESDGSLKWRFNDHPKVTFGDEIMDDYYNTAFVLHNDFDGDGEQEIVSVFNNHPWFPSRLVVMDFQGNILEEYWNAGYIKWVLFVDIDGDGTDEIVFGGTNNDYDQAILGVLEYGSISGHSPQDDINYIPKGVPPGNQRFYIRFPTVKPTIYTLSDNARMLVTQISDLGKKQLDVRVSDGLSKSAGIFYTIDYEMVMGKVGLSDGFLHSYFETYGRDLYDDFEPDFITEYFSKLEYWDGDKWVTEPTENKHWKKISVK
ncbi:MAG: VCBS repeat-containing protein [Candidatus Marinimicrobia bacterium]|nr:VCBS repeat-containing protein [Candidatus Neomarinimicrobiota bacterium]